jgi:hypothetical protein
MSIAVNIQCELLSLYEAAVPQHIYAGAGEERMYSSYSFTTSSLDGGEWSASLPGRALPPGKDPGTHSTGGWVGPREFRTQMLEENFLPLTGIEPRSPGHPVRIQTLY